MRVRKELRGQSPWRGAGEGRSEVAMERTMDSVISSCRVKTYRISGHSEATNGARTPPIAQ
jgi:hypothetical protein